LNASANPSGSLDMYDPWSACMMPIMTSAVSSHGNNPVQTIPSLGVTILAVVVVVVADMGGGWEWDVGGRGESLLCVCVAQVDATHMGGE
jgi:hypothetical protein